MLVSLLAGVALSLRASPISRVVELIQELKANIEADGKAEQQVYDKFACWCEETTSRKASDIDNASNRIEELTTLIEQNSGRKGTFKAEINQLKKDIAANQVSQAEATVIRKKQRESYTKERFETEQCIGALEHATKVLEGAGTDKSSTLQKAMTLSIVKGVNQALNSLPADGGLSAEDRKLVDSFVNQAHGSRFMQVSNNPFGDYAPASTQIQGILKNMYDTFVAQMERSDLEEANQSKAYKSLTKTKKEESATLQETLVQKTTAHAENGESLAESRLERSDSEKQVAADKKFLEETKNNCKNQAEAWAERSRLRTEELGGISKAVEILGSQEALFTRSSSFLQLPTNKAFNMLSKMAQKHHSLRLAALAVQAKTKTRGHFDDVIKMINDMVSVIRKEDQDDIDAKDTCDREYAALKSESGDLAHYAEKNANLIEALQRKAESIQKRLDETQQEIDTTNDEIEKALEERTSQKNEFEKSLQDDKDAARLIGQAVVTLSAFYKNNKLALGFAQQPGENYTIDQDKAPETFKDSYKGRSSESGGIVAILKMLKEDVENEIQESIHNEAQAQKDYEETKRAALKNLAALKQTRVSLKNAQAKNSEASANADGDANNLKNLGGANGGSFEAHCTECQWTYNNGSPEFGHLSEKCPNLAVSDVSSFDSRKSKRKDELQGLQDALAALAGASADDQ
eukprot:GEMP01018454.1.p1 GENE.GEMP01018454.1~~GEMP01018454.1.p1  ORF type:complete len:691 (+),score=169.77 GEMP01018454.1:40-2112(+)